MQRCSWIRRRSRRRRSFERRRGASRGQRGLGSRAAVAILRNVGCGHDAYMMLKVPSLHLVTASQCMVQLGRWPVGSWRVVGPAAKRTALEAMHAPMRCTHRTSHATMPTMRASARVRVGCGVRSQLGACVAVRGLLWHHTSMRERTIRKSKYLTLG